MKPQFWTTCGTQPAIFLPRSSILNGGDGCGKKGETAKLEDKQKEAKNQIERYSEFEDIKDIEGLRKYTIVVAGNEIFVQEIE